MTELWIPIKEKLPEIDKLVWLLDTKTPAIYLGCRTVPDTDGWLWAVTDGTSVYLDGTTRKIVADCILEDVHVDFWQPCPKIPNDLSNVNATTIADDSIKKTLIADFLWETAMDYNLWDESIEGAYPANRIFQAMQKFSEVNKIPLK